MIIFRSSLVEGSTGYRQNVIANELACYMHATAMRMRCQYHASNIEILNCSIDGPDPIQVSLARTSYSDRILSRRENLYFGSYLTGADALNLPPMP